MEARKATMRETLRKWRRRTTEIAGESARAVVPVASLDEPMSRQELTTLVHHHERRVRKYLNTLSRAREDPVRTKNLEKIAAHLQAILYFVAQQDEELPPGNRECLCCLLAPLSRPWVLSADNVWELADALEVMLVRLGDDSVVRQWIFKEFPGELPASLLHAPRDSEAELDVARARQYLIHRLQEQAQEYRRDRAKMRLRQRYLIIMSGVLLILLTGFSAALLLTGVAELAFLILVLSAGAIGSVLSRAIKLSKQPLREEAASGLGRAPTREPPLGIRALLSGWTVFVAQPLIGATASLMLALVFLSGILQVAGLAQLNPAAFAILAFLAGYSEPFFTDILGKFAGKAGGQSAEESK